MAQSTTKIRKRKLREGRELRPRPETHVAASGAWLHLSAWQWTGAALLVAAAFLRLYQLTEKVLHHDEGVNGLFMTNLFRTGYYHYDPSNYHGPTLYYAGLITTTLNAVFYGKYGLSTFAVRLVTAIFGIALVWLFLCLRRQLGTFGAISAGLLAGVSSGLVFFSRYFIHEILFVFFTLGVVVALLRYRETRQPKYLFLTAASLALLGATKETWIITVVVWVMALLCMQGWMYLRGRRTEAPPAIRPANTALLQQESTKQLYATAALIFIAVWVLFYSSFFTNFPQGLYDSVKTFTYWFKTGRTDDLGDLTTYLRWLVGGPFATRGPKAGAELAAMALGFVGSLVALVQARSRFAVFGAFWSLGIFAAYSLVPYKTPWLALSIVVPFIIMAGYGLEQMYRRSRFRVLAIALLATATAGSLYQAIDLSFNSYDDETQPYSYAHSKRDFLILVDEVEHIAAGNPAGKNVEIAVLAVEHWPLPWYLREFSHVGYYGKVMPATEPIVIAQESQLAELRRVLGDKYREFSAHELRPGVKLYVFLRNDVQP
ncbi:MAG TPA: flippase activity-associated protein Agl23 [Terriglobales bacterium]|nr:flippase activity-associated protein Agl23 [Terriglobales bacterium]